MGGKEWPQQPREALSGHAVKARSEQPANGTKATLPKTKLPLPKPQFRLRAENRAWICVSKPHRSCPLGGTGSFQRFGKSWINGRVVWKKALNFGKRSWGMQQFSFTHLHVESLSPHGQQPVQSTPCSPNLTCPLSPPRPPPTPEPPLRPQHPPKPPSPSKRPPRLESRLPRDPPTDPHNPQTPPLSPGAPHGAPISLTGSLSLSTHRPPRAPPAPQRPPAPPAASSPGRWPKPPLPARARPRSPGRRTEALPHGGAERVPQQKLHLGMTTNSGPAPAPPAPLPERRPRPPITARGAGRVPPPCARLGGCWTRRTAIG